MGVSGVGVDLVDLDRFARFVRENGPSIGRVFCEGEADLFDTRDRNIARLAGIFAAKEALLKAAGIGFAGGVDPREIRVVRGLSGAPRLQVSGVTKRRLDAAGVTTMQLSITHTATTAGAVVVTSRGCDHDGAAHEGATR